MISPYTRLLHDQEPKKCKCKIPVLSVNRQWLLRFQGGAYRCNTCNGYRRKR